MYFIQTFKMVCSGKEYHKISRQLYMKVKRLYMAKETSTKIHNMYVNSKIFTCSPSDSGIIANIYKIFTISII